MKTYQNIYQHGAWESPLGQHSAHLVLLFGDRDLATDNGVRAQLRDAFPGAQFVGCTTSGEIQSLELHDNSLCLTALNLKSSRVQVEHTVLSEHPGLTEAANALASALEQEGLRYVLVLSDGQQANGTELIQGLESRLPRGVGISGGLAGDGKRFSESLVWHNDAAVPGQIVAVGFYGKDICIGHGSMGGWDPFGPERLVTRSHSNILYTLDNKPALQWYKSYLGDHAKELPSSALLLPLIVRPQNSEDSVIRAILNINEDDNSLIFAGDVPEGATVQLLRANFDRLIDGAENAAESALNSHSDYTGDGLALLISCAGRRRVLNQRVEEELESVGDVLGNGWAYTGFYSYGEISPLIGGNSCAFHNQTMTITTIFERNA